MLRQDRLQMSPWIERCALRNIFDFKVLEHSVSFVDEYATHNPTYFAIVRKKQRDMSDDIDSRVVSPRDNLRAQHMTYPWAKASRRLSRDDTSAA